MDPLIQRIADSVDRVSIKLDQALHREDIASYGCGNTELSVNGFPKVCPAFHCREPFKNDIVLGKGGVKWLKVMAHAVFTGSVREWVLSNPVWGSNGIKLRADGSATMVAYCRLGGSAIRYRSQVSRRKSDGIIMVGNAGGIQSRRILIHRT